MRLPHISITGALICSGCAVSSYFVDPRKNHHGSIMSLHRQGKKFENEKVNGPRSDMTMFLGQTKRCTQKNTDALKTSDTTKIGNTVVPSIGIGTISWSSDSL